MQFLTTALAAAAMLAAPAAFAQHAHGSAHGGHGAPAAQSPYAGESQREIKALSDAEQRAWLEGQGMRLALPAELNGYPGPMHVLELADALGLTPAQREATTRLMQAHKAQARALGQQLVDAERRLDQQFAQRTADEPAVAALTGEIGALQARVRASHLQTHLRQTALLSAEQVARYQVLRGYAR